MKSDAIGSRNKYETFSMQQTQLNCLLDENRRQRINSTLIYIDVAAQENKLRFIYILFIFSVQMIGRVIDVLSPITTTRTNRLNQKERIFALRFHLRSRLGRSYFHFHFVFTFLLMLSELVFCI